MSSPDVHVQEKTLLEIKVNTPPQNPAYRSCTWAEFLIDPYEKRVIITSDGGDMNYQWQKVSEENTPRDFYKFLTGLNRDYLLCKLSQPSVFDFDKTVDALLKIATDPRLRYALEQARPFFSEYEFATWYMSQPGTHSDDLEAIRMDYPEGHKTAVDLFIQCVQPIIAKML